MGGGTDTIERQRTTGPGAGMGDAVRVIVLNDDHNTFEGVAASISRTIPRVDYSGGMRYATQIHQSGSACVWRGVREVAELYWQQLAASGLTMAPLE